MDFFKRHFFVALSAVLGLIIIAFVGARGNLQLVFGVVVPYMAALIFVEGLIYQAIKWARSPVPFRIPTTAGQGRTLPWIERYPPAVKVISLRCTGKLDYMHILHAFERGVDGAFVAG